MKKKEFWIFAGFAAVILLFFWDLASLKTAFLSGDHREQQYPWAKFYQEQIRQFLLPWWTPQIHCGFPILAEGQIGAFYPLNYLFFLILPTKIAYNYIILFQYWLGAVFFYLFLRRLKISVFPSFFASLIYLFGSTQGGYFYYNYISQKTVIWLPLTLILIDRLTENRKWQDAFWLSAVFAVQVFAGYLQVAIYSIFYSCLYFLFRWWVEKDKRVFLLFSSSGILAIFFSLVQLLPTLELSMLSSRAFAEKGLAYVGSMNPAGFLTFFYPSWDGFLGSELYVGLLGLFFVFFVFSSRRSKDEKFFLVLTVFFLLLALGKFSPLYRLLVDGTGFNSFRTPIKFLFFVSFSLIALSAFGLEKFLSGNFKSKSGRVITGFFAALVFFCLLVPAASSGLLKRFQPQLLPKFEKLVVQNYFGKAGHPYPLEHYTKKAADFYEAVIQTTDPSEIRTRNEMIFLFIMFLTAAFLFRVPHSRRFLTVYFSLFLLADLYSYGFTSIRGGELRFDTIDTPRQSTIMDHLRRDKTLYRVMEVYTRPEDNTIFPVFPNSNMLDGISDIGAYSPLIMRDYKKFLSGWAYTNDSLGISLVDLKILQERMADLSFLNVKYLLSPVPLAYPSLKLAAQEGSIYLYQNQDVLPRAFFIPGELTEGPIVLSQVTPVSFTKDRPANIELQVNAPSDGKMIISDIFYRGWSARLDGKPVEVNRARGLFRSLSIPAGSHTVTMKYSVLFYEALGWAALAVFIFGAFAACPIFSKKKAAVNS